MKKWKMYVRKHSETLLVTPDIAREMLEKNTHNRPLKAFSVKRIAKIMRSGDWRYVQSDNIAFDKTGKLFDGQHRLEAIVLAKTPQKMNVVYGEDPDNFSVKDTGRNRTASDALVLANKINPNDSQTAGILRLIYFGRDTAATMPPAKYIEIYDLFKDAIAFLADEFKDFKKKDENGVRVTGVDVAPVKAAIARAFHVEPSRRAELSRFCQILIDPMQNTNDYEKVVIILRSWLTNKNHEGSARRFRGKPARTSGQTEEQYGKTQRTIKYFMDKVLLSDSKLYDPKKELFPLSHEINADLELEKRISDSLVVGEKSSHFLIPVSKMNGKNGLANAVLALRNKTIRLPESVMCKTQFKKGDKVVLYAAQHGIVGTAEISDFKNDSRSDQDDFPFLMTFDNTSTFPETSVDLDQQIGKLDWNKGRIPVPNSVGLFVQSVRQINAHDFAFLTIRRTKRSKTQ